MRTEHTQKYKNTIWETYHSDEAITDITEAIQWDDLINCLNEGNMSCIVEQLVAEHLLAEYEALPFHKKLLRKLGW